MTNSIQAITEFKFKGYDVASGQVWLITVGGECRRLLVYGVSMGDEGKTAHIKGIAVRDTPVIHVTREDVGFWPMNLTVDEFNNMNPRLGPLSEFGKVCEGIYHTIMDRQMFLYHDMRASIECIAALGEIYPPVKQKEGLKLAITSMDQLDLPPR